MSNLSIFMAEMTTTGVIMDNITSLTSRTVLSDPTQCDLPLHQCETLRNIKKVILSLTFTTDFVTLCAGMIFKMNKTFAQRIFIHMVVANLFDSIGYLMSHGDVDGSLCIFQGISISITGTSQFLWVSCLTLYLFLVFTERKSKAQIDRFEWLFVCICWVLPVALSLLPLSTNDYGLASAPYCWLKSAGTSGDIWRFAIYWIPVFFGFILVMVAHIYLHWHVSRASAMTTETQSDSERQLRIVCEQLRPLKYYAIAFVILQTPQVINRLQNVNSSPLFGLLAVANSCHFVFGLVMCTLFFLIQGRQAFTYVKLKECLYEHSQTLRCQGGGDDQTDGEPIDVEGNPTPVMQRRELQSPQ